jgi:release factor glutamine methyltransferase
MVVNIQTLKDIRNYLSVELNDLYPEHEITSIINLILKTHLGIDRLHSISFPHQEVSPGTSIEIIKICKELKTGKPVQYVLGETSFYDCTIKVNNKTLIPRPETEELVDLIINENRTFRGKIIDIGTGSGCIAIALKKSLTEAEVTGIDISEDALKIARSNALINKVNVSFLKGDILNPDWVSVSEAEIIVSNPPYVMESEKKFMNKNVLDFEPHNALFVTDEDPLIFYRVIAALSREIMKPGGKLYFEINEKKGSEISNLLVLSGYNDVRNINDLNGKNRIVKGTLNG